MSQTETNEIMKSLSVLYVEDDRHILDAIQKPLGRHVKELYVATNGVEGLHIFSLYAPDIVITDIKMPVMDGLKMAREIKTQSPGTPIIIVSAFNEAEYFTSALDIGIDQYLFKPINMDALIETVERCARHVALENEVKRKSAELAANIKILNGYKYAIDVSSFVCKLDKSGNYADVNQARRDLLGYTKEELLGKRYTILCHTLLKPEEKLVIEDAIDKNLLYRGVVRMQTKSGKSLYCDTTLVPIFDENGKCREIISIERDVTEMIEKAYTDTLTNYPNRKALRRDMENVPLPMLIVIDIDDFGLVNDFYGNKIGDATLRAIIDTLNAYVKRTLPEACVYKFSGDEFAVLLPDRSLCGGIREFVQGIMNELGSVHYTPDDVDLLLSFSAGYTTQKEHALSKANIALRHAKKSKVPIACYESLSNSEQDYTRNIIWTKVIRMATENNQIVPWFQPIIDMKTKSVIQYECLMRIVNPDGTISMPDEFLPIAYRTRIYYTMSKMMIKKSCEYFADKPFDFSVNMTMREIANREMVDFLKQIVTKTGTARRFVLELLESDRYEFDIEEHVAEIRNLGCKVAIDDFGMGYSNFDRLLRLNVDYLKIDGTIISKIDTDRNSLMIAETIATFAKKLGVRTIAEYVHSDTVGNVVNRFSIDFAQGFLYGKPRPEITTK
ncbi:MAG: EAL domain-containing protein [Helicobacteraceae bacterium]|jgi:PAS domain S-box-containing protein/diguanylate cyclase (GGDEF)-like protein|nr:EAL domain-containing protein [Helicobacteraceae bacterium]